MDQLKDELENALQADSIRDIYDKLMNNAAIKSKVDKISQNFSIIPTIIKTLFPSKELVHTISTIAIVVMLIEQAVLIFELFRIRSYCVVCCK